MVQSWLRILLCTEGAPRRSTHDQRRIRLCSITALRRWGSHVEVGLTGTVNTCTSKQTGGKLHNHRAPCSPNSTRLDAICPSHRNLVNPSQHTTATERGIIPQLPLRLGPPGIGPQPTARGPCPATTNSIAASTAEKPAYVTPRNGARFPSSPGRPTCLSLLV